MIIDEREPSIIKDHDWGFPTLIEQIESADFIIGDGNKFGIERKDVSTGDYIGSVQNGRLWEQLRTMENNFDKSALFVVGSPGDLPTRQMDPKNIKTFYGALARIFVSYTTSVFLVREHSQMFRIIKDIHRKEGTQPTTKPKLDNRKFRDDRINVLYGVYGIGNHTAQNLLDPDKGGFRSVREVANASKKRLTKVEGVGLTTAEKIVSIMRDGEQSEGLL